MSRSVLRWIALAGLVCASHGTASAAIVYKWRHDLAPTLYDTAVLACQAAATFEGAKWKYSSVENFSGETARKGCKGTHPDLGSTVQRYAIVTMQGVEEEENKCKANTGKVGVVNWTEGYTRSPDEGDRAAVGGYNAPPSDGKVCDSGCLVSAQTSGAGVEFFVSQQPTAQGLYRRSADFPTVGLGEQCTASNSAPNSPVAPEPKCTGTLGQVNNKTVCVSSPAAPVTTAPMAAPSNTPIAGNPSAGPKPTSGAGSGSGSIGRTPDAGTGGNAGGSMAAAVGGKGGSAGGTSTGTGTVTAPPTGQEQAACGAPGQPVCAVKMNEEGYPDGKNAFTTAKDAIDQNATDTKTAIDGAATMQAPQWSFSFQLPTGCVPYDTGLRGFILDPCKYQSTIHDLMSMIWAAVTAFCLIGMVGRTIRES